MTTEISIKELLEKYTNDHALLKHVLMAKSEEDKRQTAKAVLKTEHARIHLRRLDMQIAKERHGYKAPLARIRSPEEPHPHSAHPLCRPHLQLSTPISPTDKNPFKDHYKVMTTLKQKIRGTHYEKRHRTLPKLHSPRLPPIDTSITTRHFL
ncbi:unnamed protein product [Rhizopus stolonifer]